MRWPFRAAPTPKVAPLDMPAPVPAARKPRRLAPMIEAAGYAPVEADVFAAAKPPPGVVPAGARGDAAKLAMDEQGRWGEGYASETGYGREGIAWFGYPLLAEMAQRPEYRRISEILAKEMTRKFIKLHATDDKDNKKAAKLDKLKDAMEEFKVRHVFRRVAELDGFFGRGHIYIDTGDTDKRPELRRPLLLSPAKIPTGGLKGLRVVEPLWTYPNIYNSTDPLHPHFYQPQSWFVMSKELHCSRLLTFVGRHVPDMLKPAYAFGGLSMTQMAKPTVENWLRTRQSVSDMIHTFSIIKLGVDLDSLTEEGAEVDLIKRIQLFVATRDNQGIFITDKETEELEQLAVPLTSLDKLQAQSQEQMAAIAGIPIVILLGITPSGLNASTDGEIRTFYGWVKAQQEAFFTDNLHRILDILQLHLFGAIDQTIGFAYEPLWELDEAGKAVVRKSDADADTEYLNSGVLSPEEVRRRLAAQEDSGYNDINVDELPERPEDPDTGGGGPGLKTEPDDLRDGA